MQMRMVSNEKNVGYDRNLEVLFRAARGEYVWLLGDDDFLEDNIIEKIVRFIDDYNCPSVILLPAQFIEIGTQSMITGYCPNQIKFFKTGDSFFQETLWATSAMSTLIIKRENWLSCNLMQFYDSQWIHIGAIISILAAPKSNSLIIPFYCVMVRTNNPRWQKNNGNQLSIAFYHLKLMKRMLSFGYARQTYEKYKKNRLANALKDIVILKPNSFRARCKIAVIMMTLFPTDLVAWFLCLPMLLLTPRINPLLRNIKRFIKRQNT